MNSENLSTVKYQFLFLLQPDLLICALDSSLSSFSWDFVSVVLFFLVYIAVRPKIRAFVPRRKNRVTQQTSPADATRKRVY